MEPKSERQPESRELKSEKKSSCIDGQERGGGVKKLRTGAQGAGGGFVISSKRGGERE